MVVTIFLGSSWIFYEGPSRAPPEPDSLKIVAIDTGAGLLYLDPDGGGVAVQEESDVCFTTVQENEGLKIYQSTKHVQLTGGCFEDNMKASTASSQLALDDVCTYAHCPHLLISSRIC